MVGRAKLGDRVQVRYVGSLQDGTSTRQLQSRQVLEFRVGSKKVMPGVSLGVVGMAAGESKRVTLKPEEAYGAIRNELIREIPRRRFPSTINLEIGKWLANGRRESGHRRRFQIVDIKASTVVVDGNHPFAGKVLDVEMQVISLEAQNAD